MIRIAIGAWVAMSLLALTLDADAQSNEKPLKLVVPFSAGTATDALARELGQALAAVSKQPVVIDNRTGAEGNIGGQAVATAAADGYTALFTSSSLAVLDPLMRKSPLVDPVKDFTAVCAVGRSILAVFVRSSLPYKTLAEFVAAAKANPNKFTYAYSSATVHLASELFQQQAGVKLRGIPYRATMSALVDVAGDQVDMIIIDPFGAGALFQTGKIRPIVVAAPKRMRNLPDVPSSAEVGIPAFDMSPWFSVFLPAKTPPSILSRFREQVAKAVASQAMDSSRKKMDLEEIAVCGDEMTAYQLAEMDRWRDLIKKSGIELQ
jgi:tripartite-type tricarboxylate transporter receptor subunit TctC